MLNLFSYKAAGVVQEGMESHRIAPGLMLHVLAMQELSGQGATYDFLRGITGNSYKATAETLEPAQVNFIRRDEFVGFMKRHSDVCHRVIEQLTKRDPSHFLLP